MSYGSMRAAAPTAQAEPGTDHTSKAHQHIKSSQAQKKKELMAPKPSDSPWKCAGGKGAQEWKCAGWGDVERAVCMRHVALQFDIDDACSTLMIATGGGLAVVPRKGPAKETHGDFPWKGPEDQQKTSDFPWKGAGGKAWMERAVFMRHVALQFDTDDACSCGLLMLFAHEASP